MRILTGMSRIERLATGKRAVPGAQPAPQGVSVSTWHHLVRHVRGYAQNARNARASVRLYLDQMASEMRLGAASWDEVEAACRYLVSAHPDQALLNDVSPITNRSSGERLLESMAQWL